MLRPPMKQQIICNVCSYLHHYLLVVDNPHLTKKRLNSSYLTRSVCHCSYFASTLDRAITIYYLLRQPISNKGTIISTIMVATLFYQNANLLVTHVSITSKQNLVIHYRSSTRLEIQPYITFLCKKRILKQKNIYLGTLSQNGV